MQLWFTGEKEYRRARKKEEKKFQDSIMDLEFKDICMGSEMIAFTKKDCPIYSKSRR